MSHTNRHKHLILKLKKDLSQEAEKEIMKNRQFHRIPATQAIQNRKMQIKKDGNFEY